MNIYIYIYIQLCNIVLYSVSSLVLCGFSFPHFISNSTMLQQTRKFSSIKLLLTFLSECEIEQGIKYVHHRAFTAYEKSLDELNCGMLLLRYGFFLFIFFCYHKQIVYKNLFLRFNSYSKLGTGTFKMLISVMYRCSKLFYSQFQ